jgi:hypothetical protein
MNPRRTLLCVQSIWVQAVHVKDALLYLCLGVAGANQCSFATGIRQENQENRKTIFGTTIDYILH